MVLVEVYVPSVNQTYDFNIEEQAKIAQVTGELCEMIAQKEQTAMEGEEKELLLVSQDLKRVLNPEKTFAFYEIHTGDRLVLV